jgi:hypothetical protein
VQACTQLEQLRVRMAASQEPHHWRLGPEVSPLFAHLCMPNPASFAQTLRQCPDMEYWKRGVTPAQYNATLSPSPSPSPTDKLPAAVRPAGENDERMTAIARSLDGVMGLLVILTLLLLTAACGAVAAVVCFKKKADGQDEPPNVFFWRSSS